MDRDIYREKLTYCYTNMINAAREAGAEIQPFDIFINNSLRDYDVSYGSMLRNVSNFRARIGYYGPIIVKTTDGRATFTQLFYDHIVDNGLIQ